MRTITTWHTPIISYVLDYYKTNDQIIAQVKEGFSNEYQNFGELLIIASIQASS